MRYRVHVSFVIVASSAVCILRRRLLVSVLYVDMLGDLLTFFFQAEDGIRDLCVTGVHTCVFFFSSRRRHTRSLYDWSSDVCSSDLCPAARKTRNATASTRRGAGNPQRATCSQQPSCHIAAAAHHPQPGTAAGKQKKRPTLRPCRTGDRKSVV